MNAKEIRVVSDLIDKAIDKTEDFIKGVDSEKENPAVRNSYQQAIGRRDALKSVKEAINGNKFDLTLYSL